MPTFGRSTVPAAPAKKASGRLATAKPRDDDDDERPTRSTTKSTSKAVGKSAVPASGWDGAQRAAKAATDPNTPWRPETGTNVIFLLGTGAPVASWNVHWIERKGPKGEVTRTPIVCVETAHDNGCPLCDRGYERKAEYRMNVVVLSPNSPPMFALYGGNKTVLDYIKEKDTELKSKGGSKHRYFEIDKSGSGFQTKYAPALIRSATRLSEDYDIEPLSDEEIEAFDKKCKKPEDFADIYPTPKAMRETARELDNTDDLDD